jgi:predicted extracellular nuclease
MPLSRLVPSRRLAALLVAPLLLAPVALASPAAAVSPNLVISQVYGGGGNSGAPLTNDYIEIFNRGSSAASLSGMSLQYASATGTGNFGANSGQLTELPAVAVPAGGYVLVQEAGGTTGVALPAPDVTDTTPINMSGTAGKVALVTGTTTLGCNGGSTACDAAALARIVDLVGYGGANFFEGASAAPALTNSTAALRGADGCTDTDNNGDDFASSGPAPRNSASPVHLCGGGDAAPTVSSTNPANGATDVPVDSNLEVTFSEPVTLAGNPFSLDCTTSGSTALAVSGGPTTYTLDPATNLEQSESCTATVAASGVTDADTEDPPDQMAADFSWSFTTAAPAPSCDDPETHTLSQVPGSGPTSPVVNTEVTVQAVVTADRTGGLSGFFVQEETADQDGDPATSDGVFVRTSLPAGAGEGDVVQVTGTVQEFTGSGSSQTQISSGVTVLLCGPGELPPAAVLTFPVADVGDFERYEGMRTTLPQSLVISEYFNYDRFNETVVGLPMPGRDRFDTPTAVVDPGAPANDLAAEYAKRRITIDDGRSSQNASPPYFPGTVDTPFTLGNRFRGGDTVTGVTGVVEHTFGLYRVHPTEDAAYTAVNPRPDAPPAVGGDVKVGSFNVLNYFLTLDQAPTRGTCGPSQNQDCRGADNAGELERQRAKIVDAIARLDADVVGLMEMENTTGVEPAADLVAGLNDRLGAGTYDFVDTGVVGTDAIRTGFLYQPASVTPAGDFAVLDTSVDPRFLDTKNRPAIAQTFDEVATGHRFTVAVNHLKSKGSDCNDVGDPDAGDGQGNCNGTRTLAAEALADWLATDPTGSGDPDRLVIGDLNSYDHEDPIAALEDAGYTDLVKQFGGEFAYGYVFDGQVGYLDHGLANGSLQPQVTGAGEWHLNADEPDLLDYDTSFKGPNEDALYEPNAFRSSDHDAVLIGLDLVAEVPVVTDVTGNGSVDCDGESTVTVEFSDASLADTHDATIDWGDGTSDTLTDVSSPFTASHTYALAGAYEATVTVEDSSGNTSEPATVELVKDYTVVGGTLEPPIGSGTTKNYGSTTPVKVSFADCDGSTPDDLAPTLTVLGASGYSLDAGELAPQGGGTYQLDLKTTVLPGPGHYTYVVTVPETGQQVSAPVTLR